MFKNIKNQYTSEVNILHTGSGKLYFEQEYEYIIVWNNELFQLHYYFHIIGKVILLRVKIEYVNFREIIFRS